MQKGFSSIIILLIAFLMIAVLGVGIWYYFEFQSSQQDQATTQVPIIPNAPQTSPYTQASDIPPEWIQAASATNDFVFAHPPEAQVQESLEGTSISIFGPTQTENTEFYDGLALTISTAALNERGLEEVATMLQSDAAADQVYENVTPVQQVQYAGREGYRFTTTGLGTWDTYILPLASDLYIKVINATVDPTGVGFEKTAEEIVSTIQES